MWLVNPALWWSSASIMALATATATLTFTRASIFQPVRVWIKARSQFVGDLIRCTYCFSHWCAAALVCWWQRPPTLVAFAQWWLPTVALATLAIAAVYEAAKRIGPAAEDRDPDE